MFKKCVTCKQEKQLDNFRKDSRRLDGAQSYCKDCARSYHKSAYISRYGQKVKERSKERHLKAKEYINSMKAISGCVVCGEKESVCLDFHHSDPNVKEFTISKNYNRSLDVIKEEISKCIVVCRNCHAKIHAGLIGEVPESGLMEQS